MDDIKNLADFGGERGAKFGDGKVALVATRDIEFGLARMLSAYAEDVLESEFAVFRSQQEARDWLAT